MRGQDELDGVEETMQKKTVIPKRKAQVKSAAPRMKKQMIWIQRTRTITGRQIASSAMITLVSSFKFFFEIEMSVRQTPYTRTDIFLECHRTGRVASD